MYISDDKIVWSSTMSAKAVENGEIEDDGGLAPEVDYDILYNEVIPGIERQCYGGSLWMVGDYSGADDVELYFCDSACDIGYFIESMCYPDERDTESILFSDNGELCFTENSTFEKSRIDNSFLRLYSFKDARAYSDAAFGLQEQDDRDFRRAHGIEPLDDVQSYGDDLDYVAYWIEQGLLTPIDAESVY